MPTVERSRLHVEGRDDVHVVKHLLLRHDIDCPIEKDSRPARDFAPTTIKARFFRDDSPSALAFVDWYRRVFP